MIHRGQSGDYAWFAILAYAIMYELTSDDLLSEATERYWTAHPLLTRMIIIAVAGHLAGLVPSAVDVFSAKNVLHRAVVAISGVDRTKRSTA